MISAVKYDLLRHRRALKSIKTVENSHPYHIFPVQHLQDVAQQLATSLQLLLLLQVELQLVCHQWQEDLTAICGDTAKHSMSC